MAMKTQSTRPRLVLAMLLVVYIFNFVDRQILAILAAPIQQELGLSDRQLGLLGGIAFALLYSTLGVPLAWLADRTSRSWVVTGSLVLWSGFTALCGLATGFWQIFLARLGVGIGEAGASRPPMRSSASISRRAAARWRCPSIRWASRWVRRPECWRAAISPRA